MLPIPPPATFSNLLNTDLLALVLPLAALPAPINALNNTFTSTPTRSMGVLRIWIGLRVSESCCRARMNGNRRLERKHLKRVRRGSGGRLCNS
ncbi:hypothetical protein BDQ12DRAFT_693422 [Crucibulum laeve]|uniref:Secreted protein n=1 Tax=Crucibulum laeve TaxID=68775 RepID=A0A5C3LGC1_9AGAR|nr:hypothetical protein BDQ12DRAFT_693422 [Crucibulum laeve]